MENSSEFDHASDLSSVQENPDESLPFGAAPGGGVLLWPSPQSQRLFYQQNPREAPPGFNPNIPDEEAIGDAPGADEVPRDHGSIPQGPMQSQQTTQPHPLSPQSSHSTSQPGHTYADPSRHENSSTSPWLGPSHRPMSSHHGSDLASNRSGVEYAETLAIDQAMRQAQSTLQMAAGIARDNASADASRNQRRQPPYNPANVGNNFHGYGQRQQQGRGVPVAPFLNQNQDAGNTNPSSLQNADPLNPALAISPGDNVFYVGGPHDNNLPEDMQINPFRGNQERRSHLYLVTFKSSRADVFYIPANFGPEPNIGDMVVVEGDRGEDLGMVAHSNISFEQARHLKAEYNRKHYNCLVRFARIFPRLAETVQEAPMYEAHSSYNLADQTRNRKNPNPQPKLIKRIATEREVMLLREKEGNEARAKRICQAKCNENDLQMEVLDAEFQLDYRKLTFYFYAEHYINFNNIVTDLFKVWKTRIWLSAVNPQTYPTPSHVLAERAERRGRGDPRPHDAPTTPASATFEHQEDETRMSAAYYQGFHDFAAGLFGQAYNGGGFQYPPPAGNGGFGQMGMPFPNQFPPNMGQNFQSFSPAPPMGFPPMGGNVGGAWPPPPMSNNAPDFRSPGPGRRELPPAFVPRNQQPIHPVVLTRPGMDMGATGGTVGPGGNAAELPGLLAELSMGREIKGKGRV